VDEFGVGDVVMVTVDWLDVPADEQGVIVGFGYDEAAGSPTSSACRS
jgi:hypothetical protein